MAKDAKKTAVISIRVRPEIKSALEVLADEERRSLASYLELLLEQHIDDRMNSKAPALKPRK